MSESIHLKADYSDFETVIDWVKPLLFDENVGKKTVSRMILITEEIFTNVAKYAYPNSSGDIDVTYSSDDKNITMVFTDSGIPFDPTKVKKPKINIPLNKRTPGGLGIYISKLFVDKMLYKREDDKNILTIIKKK